MTGKRYDRRYFLHLLGLGAAAALTGCRMVGAGAAKKPLNVVFMLADDLGWTDLGCFGSRFYETPHLDRLASEGMRFTSGYAACPVCSPTRASIMTGKYPARMATTDYFGAPQPAEVPKHWTRNKPLLPAPYEERMAREEVTLAEAFKEAGYATGFAGKWHLGDSERFWPEAQGFDFNKGGCANGAPSSYFSPYKNPRLPDGPPGEHLPDRLAGEICTFIETNKDNPFLAYLAFYSVHVPLQARPDLKQKYEAKHQRLNLKGEFGQEGDRKVRLTQEHIIYAAMVEAMDQAVGKVLNKLRELGLDDNTAVVFMSDNGGLSTAEGSPTSNLPLRAGKGWLYEGGIREPLIIKWPGETKPGGVCDHPVISTDFYPTLLEMAGLPPRPGQHCDGKSFVPLLRGERFERGPNFWHYPHYGNQGGAPGGAVRDGDWKLIQWFEDNRLELYNLKEDIGEKTNLASRYPAQVKRLHSLLANWQREVNARFPTPNSEAEPAEK